MSDWKFLVNFVSQHWPSAGACLAIFGYLCHYLNVQQAKLTVQTKDKGRFYMEWDHNQADQIMSAPKKQTPALPKAPKSSKHKKLAK